ncbi:hypothetical protein Mgra_00006303 [Meloidogyne graminicola]|uniref:Uncharacterized protein n=1 Tax=Meloidogyne graminicola TaxID=189291 RepID=A0A8S9ZLN5_9BILA|nr:hypothetical protein Mgra_00006303 [Meloidogyne graminicola]
MGLLTILMYILAMIFIVQLTFMMGYFTNTYIRYKRGYEIVPDLESEYPRFRRIYYNNLERRERMMANNNRTHVHNNNNNNEEEDNNANDNDE